MARNKHKAEAPEPEQERDYASVLAERMLALIDEMTEDEKDVFTQIGDTFDDAGYPVLIFQNSTLDELNSAFSVKIKGTITERVRQALDCLRKYDDLNTMTGEAPTEGNKEALGEMLLKEN